MELGSAMVYEEVVDKRCMNAKHHNRIDQNLRRKYVKLEIVNACMEFL